MKLYPHQIEALQQTSANNRVAYYLDMGLGKTYVGSEKLDRLGSKLNLVVCQKSKIGDWVVHFKEHYKDYVVLNLTNPIEHKAYLEEAETGNLKMVGVINYDVIFRRKQLLQLTDFTLMLDESSLIQNPTAQRTKAILKMKPANVILLSGTPTSGKYENLWSQMHLLGWDISQKLYQNHYVNWETIWVGGFPQRIVSRKNPYKNVDRLKDKMREHGAVFLKTEECFNLPDQNFIRINVPATKEYWKFIKNSYLAIDTSNSKEFKLDSDFMGSNEYFRKELVGDTQLTKLLYSRMLCGQYCKAKLQALRDLVESTNDRMIIFYNFNEELGAMENHLWELGRKYSYMNGSTKDLTAYENDGDSITFVQYQSGSMGLNLQKANKIVYFTLPLLSEHFEQSKKRIHRIGQEKPCFYYTMICKGSVEEEISKLLEKRKNYTDKLFEKDGNDDE